MYIHIHRKKYRNISLCKKTTNRTLPKYRSI